VGALANGMSMQNRSLMEGPPDGSQASRPVVRIGEK
jgi:hypothetical protein